MNSQHKDKVKSLKVGEQYSYIEEGTGRPFTITKLDAKEIDEKLKGRDGDYRRLECILCDASMECVYSSCGSGFQETFRSVCVKCNIYTEYSSNY